MGQVSPYFSPLKKVLWSECRQHTSPEGNDDDDDDEKHDGDVKHHPTPMHQLHTRSSPHPPTSTPRRLQL